MNVEHIYIALHDTNTTVFEIPYKYDNGQVTSLPSKQLNDDLTSAIIKNRLAVVSERRKEEGERRRRSSEAKMPLNHFWACRSSSAMLSSVYWRFKTFNQRGDLIKPMKIFENYWQADRSRCAKRAALSTSSTPRRSITCRRRSQPRLDLNHQPRRVDCESRRTYPRAFQSLLHRRIPG